MEGNALVLRNVSSSVERLKRIIGDRYGKDLILRTLIDLGDQAQDQEFAVKGEDLHVAIKVQENFLGTIVIPKAKDLTSEGMRSAAQIVRMIMEPSLYNWFLTRQESNIRELLQEQHLEQMPVQKNGEADFSQDELAGLHVLDADQFSEVGDEFEELDSEAVSKLVLLQGTNSLSIKKVAMQIHEISQRWALVPFKDLSAGLNTVQDITKLGEMTILIENVESLSRQAQDLIAEYIAKDVDDKHPIFIASSALSIPELQKLNLNSRLIDELSVNAFDVEKAPLDYSRLKEVLELFFFKTREAALDS